MKNTKTISFSKPLTNYEKLIKHELNALNKDKCEFIVFIQQLTKRN